MKANEITSKFTDAITAAIAEGFTPCMSELTGSYSDVEGTQWVLAKGRERIVLWQEKEGGFGGETERINLYGARFELAEGESTEWNYHWSHDWKEHLFMSETVYRVDDRWRGEAWYSEDEADATEARDVRSIRRKARDSHDCYDYREVTDKMLRIVRKLKGFKSVKRDNIKARKLNGGGWEFRNVASGNTVRLSA